MSSYTGSYWPSFRYGMSGSIYAPLLNAHPGFELRTIVQRKTQVPRVTLPFKLRAVDDVLEDRQIELVIVNPITRMLSTPGKHLKPESM